MTDKSRNEVDLEVLRSQLAEVFGDPTNAAPAGTGAVLTSPSQLSFALVSQVVREMPMDSLFFQIGKLAARQLADQLERQGLKASDYAGVPELAQITAKRITSRLHASEQFAVGLVEGLMQRG